MRLIKRKDVRQLISMEEIIQTMRDVFAAVGRNEVIHPERTVLETNDKTGTVLFMPGYIPAIQGIGIKIVSVFPGNISRKLPSINAQIILNHPETGEVMAVIEGGWITAKRTAAVSAVATDILANPDAEILGVFGAGVQGRSHIQAILKIRSIKNVKIYDVLADKAKDLADEFCRQKEGECQFQAVDSPDAAVTDSDIIVTVTSSENPVFDGKLLENGTHINAVGSYKPHVREVDDETIRKANLFVDSRATALIEAGDLIIPLKKGIISKNDIKAELGELVLGEKKGRNIPDEITYFKSVGMAVQDIAVAKAVYEKALENDMGIVV